MLHSRSTAIAVMLCLVGGPLLTNLDPDSCEVFTDRDTVRATNFGIGRTSRPWGRWPLSALSVSPRASHSAAADLCRRTAGWKRGKWMSDGVGTV